MPVYLWILKFDYAYYRYGNNAVEMETTAVYDKATSEFIINTPTPLAQKYWITNGAIHAKHCVVFAQLDVEGKLINQFAPLFLRRPGTP